MTCRLDIGARGFAVDIDRPIDISIPLIFDGRGPNAFGLPRAVAVVAEGGGFVGDTRRGGSCNCETVTLNPHGAGTHTECVGHISHQRLAIRDLLREVLVPALLVSVPLRDGAEGRTIERDDLAAAIDRFRDLSDDFLRALIIRTLPNDRAKRETDYSGARPPYPSSETISLVRDLGVRHLLLDLPSADREDDPHLTNHRIFWSMTEGDIHADAMGRTITEMIFVDDAVDDGPWILDLQIPPFMLDAAPSRPILFALREEKERQ